MEKKPDWLKVRYNQDAVAEVAELMRDLKLNTVCKEANCPNLGECYRKHTSTFMILGSVCTRNCRFCSVTTGRPLPPDPEEPKNIARAARRLNLRHVVLTCSTRDDLPDGGAEQFAKCVRAIREVCPGTTVEALISDMKGNTDALDTVIAAHPEVLNHNVETVRELQSAVRPQARYERSLEVLRYCKEQDPTLLTKTGFMVGLGETEEQIDRLMDDGFIPVIASVGMDENGVAYNLNADTAAAAIAIALKAQKLVMMTDIAGLLRNKDDESTLIPTVEVSEIDGYKEAGIISGGMIPKIEGLADAIYRGVSEASIIDGRVLHSILLEIFSDRGSGTLFYRRGHVR